jgi:hypothetical protein
MVDRHWFGDLSLAILLALPLAAVALPHMSVRQSVPAVSVSVTGDLATHGRISLLD